MEITYQAVLPIIKEASSLMKKRDFWIENKGNVGNDVTAMDVAVQEFLIKTLAEAFPESTFMGEEDETVWSSERVAETKWLWIIDPIDGTSNFIRDLKASAISVGLLHYGNPYLGVVYNPYIDELYYAQKGKGAFLNDTPIHVSGRDFAHSHFCTAASLYNKSLAAPCFSIMQEVYMQCDDFRRFGTASIEMTDLAAGKVELYFEMRLFPWDYAASAVIIEEAGGFVGTCSYLDGLCYHKPIPILAANTRENYEKLAAIVNKHVPKALY